MPTPPACKYCKGNYGTLNKEGEHETCTALRLHGLPPLKKVIFCVACNGTGNKPGPIKAVIDPSPQALRNIFPACPACKGKGYTE